MVKKIKIAVLISGRGSNLKALIKASQENDFPAEISLVISNKKEAKGLEIAKEHNIKTDIIDHKLFHNRQSFDQEIDRIIIENNCQIICLAGFMRILSSEFTQKWHGKMINIHPHCFLNLKAVMQLKMQLMPRQNILAALCITLQQKLIAEKLYYKKR